MFNKIEGPQFTIILKYYGTNCLVHFYCCSKGFVIHWDLLVQLKIVLTYHKIMGVTINLMRQINLVLNQVLVDCKFHHI